MLRFSSGVSLCFTLLAIGGSVGACSSDSTDGGGTAGSGSSAAGSGSSAAGSNATGGTGSGAGGTRPSNGGSSNGLGGQAGTGVAGGSGCTPGQVTCVDEATAATCSPDTGETVTVSCVEDLKEIGITSTGCVGDATKGNCDGDPADADCYDGAIVFAICGELSQDQFVDTYISCFQDLEESQGPIRCVAPFLAASGTEADCEAAAAACFEEAGGGGAGGAGGAGG